MQKEVGLLSSPGKSVPTPSSKETVTLPGSTVELKSIDQLAFEPECDVRVPLATVMRDMLKSAKSYSIPYFLKVKLAEIGLSWVLAGKTASTDNDKSRDHGCMFPGANCSELVEQYKSMSSIKPKKDHWSVHS